MSEDGGGGRSKISWGFEESGLFLVFVGTCLGWWMARGFSCKMESYLRWKLSKHFLFSVFRMMSEDGGGGRSKILWGWGEWINSVLCRYRKFLKIENTQVGHGLTRWMLWKRKLIIFERMSEDVVEGWSKRSWVSEDTNFFLWCLYRNFMENGEMADVERFWSNFFCF